MTSVYRKGLIAIVSLSMATGAIASSPTEVYFSLSPSPPPPPPRGELQGTCLADYYNPSRTKILRSFYTKVRFNELRPNEFSKTVQQEAKERIIELYGLEVSQNYLSVVCYSTDKPYDVNDVEYVSTRLDERYHERFFLPIYGIPETEEERRATERAAAERAAREEAARRERVAREEAARRETEARAAAERQRQAELAAKAKAERERLAAEQKRKVDAIASQIGPGKRPAAERLSQLNDQVKALRPKPRICTRAAYSYQWSTGGLTERAQAQAEYASLKSKACQGRGGNVGPIQCSGLKTGGSSFVNCTATISCAAYSSSCTPAVSSQ